MIKELSELKKISRGFENNLLIHSRVSIHKFADPYIISLILISQTSITAPVLGFYFAINHNNERTQLNDDIVNQLIIKAHDKEEKERLKNKWK